MSSAATQRAPERRRRPPRPRARHPQGKPAAALVPIDEYEALEETAEILSDPGAIAAIEAGLADLSHDETITFEDLRSELAERRRAR